MPPKTERSGDDVLYRIPAGGSVIFTDEIGTELLRISSVGDAVTIRGVAVAALTKAAFINPVDATGEAIVLGQIAAGQMESS